MSDWRKRRDTRDDGGQQNGREKSARIDLGLELLALARKPGTTFTRYDIAAWCGCTDAYIYRIEERMKVRLANRLKFGAMKKFGKEIAA